MDLYTEVFVRFVSIGMLVGLCTLRTSRYDNSLQLFSKYCDYLSITHWGNTTLDTAGVLLVLFKRGFGAGFPARLGIDWTYWHTGNVGAPVLIYEGVLMLKIIFTDSFLVLFFLRRKMNKGNVRGRHSW